MILLCTLPNATRRAALSRTLPRRITKPLVAQKSTTTFDTDECGIPKAPTWSVVDLFSSYPSPKLSAATFDHLHQLSALQTPESGTQEYADLKRELEGLVKLVEAVKCLETAKEDDIPDGRIWKKGTGLRFADPETQLPEDERGQALLKRAQRTFNGFYEVEADRRS